MDLTATDIDLRSHRVDARTALGTGSQFSKVRYEVYWCCSKGREPGLVKVSMDLDNSVKVKDAIDEAILLINKDLVNNKAESELLMQDSSCYEFRLASRNGEPKMDYPGNLQFLSS